MLALITSSISTLAAERRESLEAELSEAVATVEQTTLENRELDTMRRSLIGNQQRLEEELPTTGKKLASLPSIPGHTISKAPTARHGSLRAAALVGFGLILGFIASYPFETLLVSADPIAIRTTPPALAERAPTAAPDDTSPASPVATAAEAPTPASFAPAARPDPSRPSPRAAVERWASAWSDQRVGDYLDAYASTFDVPEGFDRDAWELHRTERIERPESIEVTLDALEIVASGPDSATVRFHQAYVAGAYRDHVTKTLALIWEEGYWRIARETSTELD